MGRPARTACALVEGNRVEGIEDPLAVLQDETVRNLLGHVRIPARADALAVGLLADSFKGGGRIVGAWPLEDVPLSRSQRIELQRQLAARGHDPGAVDGIIGANTRKAIRACQQEFGWPADGYPAPALLDRLRTP